MQAGLLNQLIEIYKPELYTNEYGEQVQKYVKVQETKAQVINNSGNRENTNNEIFYAYSKTFRVRRYISIFENYRIRFQKKMFRILSIEENRKFNELIIETEMINE